MLPFFISSKIKPSRKVGILRDHGAFEVSTPATGFTDTTHRQSVHRFYWSPGRLV